VFALLIHVFFMFSYCCKCNLVLKIFLSICKLFFFVEVVHQDFFKIYGDASCSSHVECVYHPEICLVNADHLERPHFLSNLWVCSGCNISNLAGYGQQLGAFTIVLVFKFCKYQIRIEHTWVADPGVKRTNAGSCW
jgi:hypothetical protein